MSAAEDAARELATGLRRVGVGAIPFPELLSLVFALLDALDVCAPTPEAGYGVLTWKPLRLFDPFGTRLAAYRRRLASLMPRYAKHLAPAVWDAVDRGAVTKAAVAHLYLENRTRKAVRPANET